MARQEIILGTPPNGLGGDPPRVASQKINFMTRELYDKAAALKSAAFADVVGTVAGGAVIERGSNASGEFVKFADGTLLTWGGIFVINVNIAGGAGAEFDAVGKQPAAFVGAAQHKVTFAFFANSDGGGQARYAATQTFSNSGSGVQRFFGINTGRSPDYDLPGFTIGTLVAKSYLVSFQSSGRWK